MNGHNVVKLVADIGTKLRLRERSQGFGTSITEAMDVRREIKHKLHDAFNFIANARPPRQR